MDARAVHSIEWTKLTVDVEWIATLLSALPQGIRSSAVPPGTRSPAVHPGTGNSQ